MDETTKRAAQRCVNRFSKACKMLAWKGAKDPEDWEAIDREMKEARESLMKFIDRLAQPKEAAT